MYLGARVISSIPQLMQEFLRIKNQLIFRDRSDDHSFVKYLLLFFGDDDRYFRELVGPHMAVVEEQRLFGVK
jgi:hypothetical protein